MVFGKQSRYTTDFGASGIVNAYTYKYSVFTTFIITNMYFKSKRTSLLILGVTSIAFSNPSRLNLDIGHFDISKRSRGKFSFTQCSPNSLIYQTIWPHRVTLCDLCDLTMWRFSEVNIACKTSRYSGCLG